jgi:hypothetical protein
MGLVGPRSARISLAPLRPTRCAPMRAPSSYTYSSLAAIQIAQEFGYWIARGSARRARRKRNMDLKYFHEQIFFATIRITLPDQLGNSSIGTGFLIRSTLPNYPDKAVVLLVSNKHVFDNPSKRIVLSIHKRDDNGNPLLDDFAVYDALDFKSQYYEHPDPDIDLACMNVSFLENPENKLYIRTITMDLFADYENENFLPGSDVWFIGYPDNRFDVSHNLPILRRGYVGSIPKIDFNGRKEFVIDAQVFPGSSGSPVFIPLNGKFCFCGVISQTMIKNELLRPVSTNANLGIQQIIGLGIVIKSTLVNDMVNSYINKIEKSII